MIDQLRKSWRGSCAVGVEDVDDRIFADGEHQAVGSLSTAELVQIGLELFRLAAQIYCLAEEPALDQNVRVGLTEFVGLAAGISCHTKGVAESEPLVDLRIDPDFAARPRPDAGIERRVETRSGACIGRRWAEGGGKDGGSAA
jgi:hypothetical protein